MDIKNYSQVQDGNNGFTETVYLQKKFTTKIQKTFSKGS